MVTATPNKIVQFPESAPGVFDSWRERGREYLDSTLTAFQENPWKSAAIGAGVVATVAATAYGASLIAHRIGSSETDEFEPDAPQTIDPETLPKAVALD